MITNSRELKKAMENVRNIELILEKAKKTHSHSNYKSMSEPILIELQQRQNEIIRYLSLTEAEVSIT